MNQESAYSAALQGLDAIRHAMTAIPYYLNDGTLAIEVRLKRAKTQVSLVELGENRLRYSLSQDIEADAPSYTRAHERLTAFLECLDASGISDAAPDVWTGNPMLDVFVDCACGPIKDFDTTDFDDLKQNIRAEHNRLVARQRRRPAPAPVDAPAAAPMVAAKSTVLRLSEDKAGMRLSADGKEIRFRAGKGGTPSKEMQIVRVLIAQYLTTPKKGTTVAELIKAAWPDDSLAVDNVRTLQKRIGATMRQLRDKARNAGLPEDIFPEISTDTLRDAKRRYALTCRAIEGADDLRAGDHYRSFALSYDENQSEEDENAED